VLVKTLDERVAIVTGAATGIGRGIARVLALEGAKIVIADLNAAGARETAAALREAGADAIDVEVDVADRASVEAMAATVVDSYGRIDIVAANAGIYQWDAIAEITDEVWDRINDVNVKGALHCIQAVLPGMRERHYGRIVLTSSITGTLVAAPRLAHYAASKAGQLGLMRAAAFETLKDGITVNAVQPGNVRTAGIEEMDPELLAQVERSIPLGRLAEPEEIGWAVRFFASEEAAYITGQTLVVDGGQVLPEVGS
jgi:3-oxoacyl-[acyl-carrier protein] reductase